MKVIIIGGVATGMSAASKLKRGSKDTEIIVFERTNEVSYGACGLPYYISGVNSNEELLRIRRADEFIKSGIDLRVNMEITTIDFENKMVTARNVNDNHSYEESYDKLIIATGANPILPEIEGVHSDNVFTLKSIDDAVKIKKAAEKANHITIVGAGYIGLELLETFTILGKKITLIEMADSLLPVFDPEISSIMQTYLENEKIDINLQEKVEQLVMSEGSVTGVITNKSTYPTDMVIFSIGVKPNTQFTNGRLNMIRNGAIIVDSKMKTSMEDVYAGGDCATVNHKLLGKPVYLPLGTNANKQGKIIGETLCGVETNFEGVLGTAIAKVMNLEIGMVGLTEKQARSEGIDFETTFITGESHAPYYPNPTNITIKLVYGKHNKKVIGAQLIGEKGVALRTDVFAACIHSEMKVNQLQYLDLGYAPPFASVWDVIHISAGKAK